MDDELLGFSKAARSLMRVLRLLTLQEPFKQFSVTSEFKSPIIRILLELFKYTSRPLFRWCRWRVLRAVEWPLLTNLNLNEKLF